MRNKRQAWIVEFQVRFHSFRLCTQIEAKELRSEAAATPDHTQRPEDVADRVRYSYVRRSIAALVRRSRIGNE